MRYKTMKTWINNKINSFKNKYKSIPQPLIRRLHLDYVYVVLLVLLFSVLLILMASYRALLLAPLLLLCALLYIWWSRLTVFFREEYEVITCKITKNAQPKKIAGVNLGKNFQVTALTNEGKEIVLTLKKQQALRLEMNKEYELYLQKKYDFHSSQLTTDYTHLITYMEITEDNEEQANETEENKSGEETNNRNNEEVNERIGDENREEQ